MPCSYTVYICGTVILTVDCGNYYHKPRPFNNSGAKVNSVPCLNVKPLKADVPTAQARRLPCVPTWRLIDPVCPAQWTQRPGVFARRASARGPSKARPEPQVDSDNTLWFPAIQWDVTLLVLHVTPETIYHRDGALLYIAYVMLIWAAPIPADRWHCSLWP